MHDFGFKRMTFYLEKYQKYPLSAKTVGVWITEQNFFFQAKTYMCAHKTSVFQSN